MRCFIEINTKSTKLHFHSHKWTIHFECSENDNESFGLHFPLLIRMYVTHASHSLSELCLFYVLMLSSKNTPSDPNKLDQTERKTIQNEWINCEQECKPFKWKISKLINNFGPFRFVYIVCGHVSMNPRLSSMPLIGPYRKYIFSPTDHTNYFDTMTLANWNLRINEFIDWVPLSMGLLLWYSCDSLSVANENDEYNVRSLVSFIITKSILNFGHFSLVKKIFFSIFEWHTNNTQLKFNRIVSYTVFSLDFPFISKYLKSISIFFLLSTKIVSVKWQSKVICLWCAMFRLLPLWLLFVKPTLGWLYHMRWLMIMRQCFACANGTVSL